MLEFKIIRNNPDFSSNLSKNKFIEFLFKYLKKFGDSKEAISKSIDYAFSVDNGKGSFLPAAYNGNEFVGELVMNKSGMYVRSRTDFR